MAPSGDGHYGAISSARPSLAHAALRTARDMSWTIGLAFHALRQVRLDRLTDDWRVRRANCAESLVGGLQNFALWRLVPVRWDEQGNREICGVEVSFGSGMELWPGAQIRFATCTWVTSELK